MLRMAGKISSTMAKLNTTTTAACKEHRRLSHAVWKRQRIWLYNVAFQKKKEERKK